MHTVSSKKVIVPVADAILSVISAVAEAETLHAHGAAADLTGLSDVVAAQVTRITAAAEKPLAKRQAEEQAEEEDVVMACARANYAAQFLVEASNNLARDPHTAHGRQALLSSVRGLLLTVVTIMEFLDEVEVADLFELLKSAKAKIAALQEQEHDYLEAGKSEKESAENEALWLQTVGQYSQQLVACLQQLLRRAADVIDRFLQSAIRDAVNLAVIISPIFVSASLLVSPASEKRTIKTVFASAGGKMLSILDAAEALVRNHTSHVWKQETTLQIIGNIQSALFELRHAVASKDSSVANLMTEFSAISASTAADCKKLIVLMNNSSSTLSNLRARLEGAVKCDHQLMSAFPLHIQSPTTATAHTLHTLLSASQLAHGALQFYHCAALVMELIVAAPLLESGATAVMDAAGKATTVGMAAGAAGRVSVAAQAFTSDVARLRALCSCATRINHARRTVDECMERAAEARFSCAADVGGMLAQAAAHLVAAATATGTASADRRGDDGKQNAAVATARAHLDRVFAAWRDLWTACQRAWRLHFTAFEIFAGAAAGFRQSADAVERQADALSGDGVMLECSTMIACANEFSLAMTRKLSESLDSALSESLEARFSEMHKCSHHPNLLTSNIIVHPVLAQFTTKAKQAVESRRMDLSSELKSSVKEISTKLAAVETILYLRNDSSIGQNFRELDPVEIDIPLVVQGVSVQLLESGTDSMVIDDDPPRVLSRKEAKLDPIQSVAQEIKVAASNWSPNQNPLIEGAHKLSEELQNFSKVYSLFKDDPHNLEVMKNAVATTKHVNSEITKIVQASKTLGNFSLDKKEMQELSDCLNNLENLGHQFKIIFATALSEGDCRNFEQQLMDTLGNLADACKRTIFLCECASRVGVREAVQRDDARKSGKSFHKTVSSGVKFRKLIYRKTGVSHGH
ncbi:hypothetical protein HDU83_007232 [Entophlyctis luteolus]|nr:hypothetical protein HDU83_007232 [Entophlyctis luteolus]